MKAADLIWEPDGGGKRSPYVSYPGAIVNKRKQGWSLTPGETLWLHIYEGDLITLTMMGSEQVFLSCLGNNNQSDFEALGMEVSSPFQISKELLRYEEIESRLRSRHIKWEKLYFMQAQETTQEEMEIRLKANRDVVLIAVVSADSDNLLAGIRRSGLDIEVDRVESTSSVLPDPLGEMRDEIHINRSTARAYEVRKGEYIQIIDVEGTQCSDFMAMRSSALDQGVERYIDSTISRTLLGGAYPQPGLLDKFYDQDMQPLLSVVQDTVGRHDTFALACTARGYENRGFPGHVNCSDNISNAYQPYGIQFRPAWPAINFFFNSWILPSDNRINSDEAWSRPGDYVLMQALTDLVCVSTACPDDIDPINGWNPTDIHVRIYQPDLTPKRSIAYRATPESDATMTKESPFHSKTSELTKQFSVATDVWMPDFFDGTGVIGEYWACREAVTIQDMSSLRKLDITGPDAEKLLQIALTRDVYKISINRGVYALICDGRGAIIDDGTLFHLGPGIYRWCCGSDHSALHLKEIAESEALTVWIRNVSQSLGNLAIQGPSSRDLLKTVIFNRPQQPDLEQVKWFGAMVGRLHDNNGIPLMVSRTGFTGELGYEIFCDASDASQVWDALLSAGREFGLTPIGNHALDLIRIEAGLMANGGEFGGAITPDEAGLGFAVDMGKEHFIGKLSIERYRIAPHKKLVGLLFEGSEIASNGDSVYIGRQPIGEITSGIHSPSLRKPIAMARVAIEHGEPGEQVEVGKLDGNMKRLPATVTTIPFIDPRREKARS